MLVGINAMPNPTKDAIIEAAKRVGFDPLNVYMPGDTIPDHNLTLQTRAGQKAVRADNSMPIAGSPWTATGQKVVDGIAHVIAYRTGPALPNVAADVPVVYSQSAGA
jgi:hypothetical protein